MNAALYPMPALMLPDAVSRQSGSLPWRETLVSPERVREYVGDDPHILREVFTLCHDFVAESLPQLRAAIDKGDVASAKHIAHAARGSLGMLGLPSLQELGEEIEYGRDEVGAEAWSQKCEALHRLLGRLQQELGVRLAA